MTTIPLMWSWQEFIDRARAPDTIQAGAGRHGDGGWAGATWPESLALATSGWVQPLPLVDVAVSALRERLAERPGAASLAAVWDVTGSEVDVAAYLGGAPECMIDHEPRPASVQGRVVTFLIPATYSHTVPHDQIMNRGTAIAALCSAIAGTAHSVEVWSGEACWVSPRQAGQVADRFAAATRVISAGEPLDLGRLIFALAHPAMLRRLWFGVWDSAEPAIAERKRGTGGYGSPPYGCEIGDLPDSRANAYVLPYLVPDEPQWRSLDAAIRWGMTTFATLGLISASNLPSSSARPGGWHLSAPPTSRSGSSPPPRPGRRQPARKGPSAR